MAQPSAAANAGVLAAVAVVKVAGHRLHDDFGKAVPMSQSPNVGGKLADPRFIVIHYTAGRGLDESVAWLCNRKAKASAHLVVGAEKIVQLVGFDREAWHAGKSSWNGLSGLNSCSIGLELDNPGPLNRTAAGWATYFGRRVDGDDVVIARHKNAALSSPETGWHAYPEAMILNAYATCEALIDAYPTIEDVIGHDDIAPQRKRDPGPAFPMEAFRSWLFGRGAG